jgi:hypothetical protein
VRRRVLGLAACDCSVRLAFSFVAISEEGGGFGGPWVCEHAGPDFERALEDPICRLSASEGRNAGATAASLPPMPSACCKL